MSRRAATIERLVTTQADTITTWLGVLSNHYEQPVSALIRSIGTVEQLEQEIGVLLVRQARAHVASMDKNDLPPTEKTLFNELVRALWLARKD